MSRPATTGQHAAGWLRDAIVSGELRPGDRVPQEEVAERIEVSVGPVREALGSLQQEGLVTYHPRRGYFVSELRAGDLVEIYELRAMLEARLARLAIPGIDAGTMERIEQAARECEGAAEAGEVAAELEANRRFHLAILEAAGQRHSMRLIRTLWDSTEAYRALYYSSPTERRASIEAHERILEALAARDAERLVGELDAHRDRALEVLLEVLPAPG